MPTLCPICKTPTDPADVPPGGAFPFCSDRCKLIDLGRWFDGRYQIPVDDEELGLTGPSEDVEDRA